MADVITSIRELQAADILRIVGYMTGFDDRYDRLLRRGADAVAANGDKAAASLAAMLEIPPAKRDYTNIILENDRHAIGHAVLVKIVPSETAVMHFHIWRGSMAGKNLGEMLAIARPLATAALRHFFSLYNLKMIIGEPAAKNPLPNRVLNSMGLQPIKTYETYVGPLGGTIFANRYEIPRGFFPDLA